MHQRGMHSLQHFWLRKCMFDQHHAGTMPRALNRLGTLVGYSKGSSPSSSPLTLSLPSFVGADRAGTPLFFSTEMLKEMYLLIFASEEVKPSLHFFCALFPQPSRCPSFCSKHIPTTMATRRGRYNNNVPAAFGCVRTVVWIHCRDCCSPMLLPPLL